MSLLEILQRIFKEVPAGLSTFLQKFVQFFLWITYKYPPGIASVILLEVGLEKYSEISPGILSNFLQGFFQ